MEPTTIAIQHDGKNIVLMPNKITGELIDKVRPVFDAIKQLSLNEELTQIILDDDHVFALFDLSTMNLREGVSQEQLQKAMISNRKLTKALMAPTYELHTTPEGRSLMADIIRLTVKRDSLPQTLIDKIDSPATPPEPVKVVTVNADGEEVVEEKILDHEPFWQSFDVEKMIAYVEGFRKRARI